MRTTLTVLSSCLLAVMPHLGRGATIGPGHFDTLYRSDVQDYDVVDNTEVIPPKATVPSGSGQVHGTDASRLTGTGVVRFFDVDVRGGAATTTEVIFTPTGGKALDVGPNVQLELNPGGSFIGGTATSNSMAQSPIAGMGVRLSGTKAVINGAHIEGGLGRAIGNPNLPIERRNTALLVRGGAIVEVFKADIVGDLAFGGSGTLKFYGSDFAYSNLFGAVYSISGKYIDETPFSLTLRSAPPEFAVTPTMMTISVVIPELSTMAMGVAMAAALLPLRRFRRSRGLWSFARFCRASAIGYASHRLGR